MIYSFINNIIKAFTKGLCLIFPFRCYGCDCIVPSAYILCDHCLSEVSFIRPPFCRVCMSPLVSSAGELCPRCRRRKPTFASLRSAIEYDGMGKQLILKFKHADRLDLAKLFALWLQFCAADTLARVDLLVPVPLHHVRRLTRQYNQAALLAAALARLTGKEFNGRALIRRRYTPSQGHRSQTERRHNVAGAFAVKNPAAFKGARIAVIDDVITTGATALECTRVLKAAGAKEVHIITIARV
jgi:ComF family protein